MTDKILEEILEISVLKPELSATGIIIEMHRLILVGKYNEMDALHILREKYSVKKIDHNENEFY